MSATIGWFYQRLPGWMSLAALELKRRVRPSDRYKRLVRLYDRMGRPTDVRSGPFAGMRYLWYAAGSALLPKLAGTYEMELAPQVEAACRAEPDLVVDVGSAEGYYAVGLARRLPAARVLAYDTSRLARYLLRQLVRRNGLDGRVEPRRFCAPADLARDLAPAARPLVVCDCEGFELELLRPDEAPGLAKATLLVELHEDLRPGVSAEIRRRFAPTHDADEIPTRPRTAADLPTGFSLPPDEAVAALDEGRSFPQTWLFLRPKAAAAGG